MLCCRCQSETTRAALQVVRKYVEDDFARAAQLRAEHAERSRARHSSSQPPATQAAGRPESHPHWPPPVLGIPAPQGTESASFTHHSLHQPSLDRSHSGATSFHAASETGWVLDSRLDLIDHALRATSQVCSYDARHKCLLRFM